MVEHKPTIFIASSAENIDLIDSLEFLLYDFAYVRKWTNAFLPGTYVPDELISIANDVDFGIFIFTPNDIIKIRSKELAATRDNVVFELGIFFGILGRGRSFILLPSGLDQYRLPSDLAGITSLNYDPENTNLVSRLSAPCYTIKQMLKKYGKKSSLRNDFDKTTVPKSENNKNENKLIIANSNNDSEYEVLSTLIIYNFSEMKADNDTYEVNSLKVSSLRFLKTGNVTISTTRRTLGKIVDSKSESHPFDTMITVESERVKGDTKTEFRNIKAGQHKIYTVESLRILKLSEPLRDRKYNDKIFDTLCDLLKQNSHRFCGTRFDAPTLNARLILYFPKSYFPDRIAVYQIDPYGVAHEDENIIIEKHYKKFVWIVECTSPRLFGALYVVWNHEIS